MLRMAQQAIEASISSQKLSCIVLSLSWSSLKFKPSPKLSAAPTSDYTPHTTLSSKISNHHEIHTGPGTKDLDVIMYYDKRDPILRGSHCFIGACCRCRCRSLRRLPIDNLLTSTRLSRKHSGFYFFFSIRQRNESLVIQPDFYLFFETSKNESFNRSFCADLCLLVAGSNWSTTRHYNDRQLCGMIQMFDMDTGNNLHLHWKRGDASVVDNLFWNLQRTSPPLTVRARVPSAKLAVHESITIDNSRDHPFKHYASKPTASEPLPWITTPKTETTKSHKLASSFRHALLASKVHWRLRFSMESREGYCLTELVGQLFPLGWAIKVKMGLTAWHGGAGDAEHAAGASIQAEMRIRIHPFGAAVFRFRCISRVLLHPLTYLAYPLITKLGRIRDRICDGIETTVHIKVRLGRFHDRGMYQEYMVSALALSSSCPMMSSAHAVQSRCSSDVEQRRLRFWWQLHEAEDRIWNMRQSYVMAAALDYIKGIMTDRGLMLRLYMYT
ncbi:uncharacterized protein MYCFIDRAFT_175860 [Pseudocercospora fijiensis CIRAD86]|uniref:Uncharacterized protein n=1 Tax=Pseudocercospora fijiensis (strain CIRAD86) TaxID=383855 RepID=M3AYS7_PSEFD|nr:uncharacterized protein MYCFIDRAFT_175860 [Pseudocercospora fijiensis CIRAD86]EME82318.1 hypothetical protein MYCFIDRAFT_175860 [Pseudocercospora fijiensis CIRAD86]